MGLLPSYYVRLALPRAWLAVGSGLDSVTNFFFFFFFIDFNSNFFWVFFGLKVEQIIFFFLIRGCS